MLPLNFQPFPEIRTPRLLLRQLSVSDADEILLFRSDPRILEYIDIPKANSKEDAIAFIHKINKYVAENESIYWGIQLISLPKLTGTICLWNISINDEKAEIGYVMHPDFQGKGIMQEAIAQVIQFGFKKMNLQTITAEVHPKNDKSIAVLIRNGFTFETTQENMDVYVLKRPFGIP